MSAALNIMSLPQRREVTGKFGKMRKAQRYTVYPKEGRYIVVQSDRSIGRFDAETGVGVLNPNGKYFMQLSLSLGAQPFVFPEEFVSACRVIAEGG
jgi:hypothetical protein